MSSVSLPPRIAPGFASSSGHGAAVPREMPDFRPRPILPAIVLVNGNGFPRKCGLLGIADGVIYLRSSEKVAERSRVSIRFSRMAVKGRVLRCTEKEDGHRVSVELDARNDARAEPRFPIDTPCAATILDDECRTRSGTLIDFSRSGVGLRLNGPCAAGSMMYIETDTLFITGEVRHCRKNEAGGYSIGLENEDILLDAHAPERHPWMRRTRWRLAQWIFGKPIRY